MAHGQGIEPWNLSATRPNVLPLNEPLSDGAGYRTRIGTHQLGRLGCWPVTLSPLVQLLELFLSRCLRSSSLKATRLISFRYSGCPPRSSFLRPPPTWMAPHEHVLMLNASQLSSTSAHPKHLALLLTMRYFCLASSVFTGGGITVPDGRVLHSSIIRSTPFMDLDIEPVGRGRFEKCIAASIRNPAYLQSNQISLWPTF